MKRYTIELKEFKNGGSEVIRTNEGLNAFEIIGLLTQTIDDIQRQLRGEVKHDITIIKKK